MPKVLEATRLVTDELVLTVCGSLNGHRDGCSWDIGPTAFPKRLTLLRDPISKAVEQVAESDAEQEAEAQRSLWSQMAQVRSDRTAIPEVVAEGEQVAALLGKSLSRAVVEQAIENARAGNPVVIVEPEPEEPLVSDVLELPPFAPEDLVRGLPGMAKG